MKKMRKDLLKQNSDLIMYGCSAHWLHLLGMVQKYFRNHHKPQAWLSEKGARGMMMCLKKAWNEWPDLVCTLSFSAVGALLVGASVYKYSTLGDRKNMYRMHYTVIREEDVDDGKKIGTVYN
ncbi:hypothetical protein LSH36_317g01013 [Paralvinella palmiformis]|uniref:Uncharacterized protein n=1 Tax=Paralvinella palmiformis TaxID=53620 RepID=A0AAD9JIK7_9ANNE|nr:hypothetical protein LSH36_317g01013 [Paralvinella palmiformis]